MSLVASEGVAEEIWRVSHLLVNTNSNSASIVLQDQGGWDKVTCASQHQYTSCTANSPEELYLCLMST